MALTVFWMYPSGAVDLGPNGWQIDPAHDLVDEAYNAPDDTDYAESMPIGSSQTWRACWSMTAPAAAVVINNVKLYARLWAVSQNSTTHDLTDVKGFVLIGGTRYYTSGQTVTGTTAAEGPRPQHYLLGAMATNPATGLAWTIPELQAGEFGVEYVDQDFGSNTPRTYIGHFYLEVEAQTIAQSIEGRRAEGTHYLLTLGRMHGTFEVMTTPAFVDVEPGQVIAVADKLGPSASGTGWGRRSWERREVLVLENEWMPMLRRCRLVLFDLRFFRVSLWWQPKTDLSYTEEGQGIPYIDSGGGWSIVRGTSAYVRKQEVDSLYAEVPIDFPKWTADGLQIDGGGDIAGTLNDSFSQGAGDAFTSWTKTTGITGTVVQDTADYMFDAAGLRRSAVFATGATVLSTAYLTQAHTVNGTTYPYARVAALFKHDAGTYAPHWQLQRSSDSWWWNNSSGAWQSAAVDNAFSIAGTGALDGLYSLMIPLSAGAVTYTLHVGYVTGSGSLTGSQTHFYYAGFQYGLRSQMDGLRSLEVTTTATVTRARDDVQIANAAPVRWWDPTRAGQIELRIRCLFEHDAMANGDYHHVLYCTGSTVNHAEALGYVRVSAGQGAWRFQRTVAGLNYFTDVTITSGFPALFQEWKLALRWTGAEGELDLPAYSLSLLANDVWSTPTTAVLQVMGAASTVYLGWQPVTGVAGAFALRSLRARRHCLTDDETIRELG